MVSLCNFVAVDTVLYNFESLCVYFKKIDENSFKSTNTIGPTMA